MPIVPVPGSTPTTPYAVTDDVRNVLGNLRDRLPSWVDLDAFLGIGHAETVDTLAGVYPSGIPTFTGDAATVVRYAEAKLAAAAVLDALRVNLPDLGDAPQQLRESAYASLRDGVVGHVPGSSEVDDDGDPDTPPVPVARSPRVSSYTPASAFPDPYDALRDAGIRHL